MSFDIFSLDTELLANISLVVGSALYFENTRWSLGEGNTGLILGDVKYSALGIEEVNLWLLSDYHEKKFNFRY